MPEFIKPRLVTWVPSSSTDTVAYLVRWSPVEGQDPTRDDPFIAVDGDAYSVVIPQDVPEFPTEPAIRRIGVSAVDAVGNESTIALSEPVPFDFVAPDAPTNIVVD